MTQFLNRFALLALMVATGCETSINRALPPLDSAQAAFQFPTGLAVRKPASGPTALLVVSSNFDLRYDQASGGTLLAVDVEGSPNALPVCSAGQPTATTCCDATRETCGASLNVLGATRMGSFGGEVAYADPGRAQEPLNLDPSACGQLGTLRPGALARVVTVSRSENAAYWMTLNDQGQLACGGASTGDGMAACAYPLVNPNPAQANRQLADAYSVTIACSDRGGTNRTATGDSTLQASALITHLQSTNDEGWLSEVPLISSKDCSASGDPCAANTPPVPASDSNPGDLRFQDLGASGESYASAYDAATSRIYVTSRLASVGLTPLRWIDFGTPRLPVPAQPQIWARQVGQFNLDSALRGSLTRDLALSHDGKRGYLAVQLYDTATASSTGDFVVLANLLVVLDLRANADGSPSFAVLKTIPIPNGPSQVRVLPRRQGKRDLVAVTCIDDGVLALYDDDLDAPSLVATIGLDQATGKPILGKQPYGLAVEAAERPLGDCHLGQLRACDRLYVGSFDRGWVNVVEVDPDDPARGWSTCHQQANCPALIKRVGRERQ